MTAPSAPSGRIAAACILFLWFGPAPAFSAPPAPAIGHPDADPAAVRAAIEATLRGMSAAVLAGDADAYLRAVWKGDPNWAREQENWAADLRRGNVPRDFEFTLAAASLDLSDGWAAAEATMSWSMKAPGPRRTLDFPARFAQSDSGEWLYAGEHWETLEGDRVRVLFPRGFERGAQVVADELPEVRQRVHEGFELEADDLVDRLQEVKLYATMDHLQQSIYLSYEEPLGGWNEPGEAIKLLATQVRRRGSARHLLAHEYGHVATFELGDKAPRMPWWALEGAAELATESIGAGRPDGLVRSWARTGELIDWPRLADFRGEARDHPTHVYKQGQHMLGYISERFGRGGRNAWLTAMAQGRTLGEATQETLGVSFEELDRQWRESLAQEPQSPPP